MRNFWKLGLLGFAAILPWAVMADSAGTPKLGSDTALIMVDVQNDFMPTPATTDLPAGHKDYKSTLPVTDGNQVIPVLSQWADDVKAHGGIVAATQDYHPVGHCSWASSGVKDRTGALGMWPNHCEQGSYGGEISPLLKAKVSTDGGDWIFRKGYLPDQDAYSGFTGGTSISPDKLKAAVTQYAADEQEKKPFSEVDSAFNQAVGMDQTGLASRLHSKGIKSVLIGGLATDYCVHATALGALNAGFKVYLLVDGSRAVNFGEKAGSHIAEDKAVADLVAKGAIVVHGGSIATAESVSGTTQAKSGAVKTDSGKDASAPDAQNAK